MAIQKVKDSMRTTTALDATKLSGNVDATQLTGAVPSGSLGNVPPSDTSVLEYNVALLAFKHASQNQITKFAMVDQMVDEYEDATGIDALNSTNERSAGSARAKFYDGGSGSTPTSSAVGATVAGGTVDGDHTYWKWISGSTGTFTTDTTQDYEYLVVAGGGGAGDWGGGGGGGGYRAATGFSIAAGTITGITVGAGGLANGNATPGSRGGNSVFSTITSTGGGGGNSDSGASTTGTGGSGGGGSYHLTAVALRTGWAGNLGGFTPVEGYAGGSGTEVGGARAYGGAGGGGAGGVGGDGLGVNGGNGGIGIDNDITGTVVGYAGGGGGGVESSGQTPGTASHGGGAGYWSTHNGNGTANTGGGAGADSGDGSNVGGTGIVVIRRLTTMIVTGADLTLQSVAATNAPATAPTTGDLVVLIDDGGSGTSAVQTNIKGFISRNGNFATLNTDHKQVTFVDEGAWGTAKQRILVARNVDISGITTGTSMKYRITTHSQSAGTMETQIHATSLAWA